MIYETNVTPESYERLKTGQKTFVVTQNRGFQQGDTVHLLEFDPEPMNPNTSLPKGLTGSPVLEYKVGYVQVLSDTEVVFSLLPKPKAAKKPKK